MLAACATRTPDEVIVETKVIERNVPIKGRPNGVQFPSVDWYIVTPENLEQKLAELEANTGEMVFFAITPDGYENLAIGIADMRRYIKEQQAIIVYYESALKKKK